MHDFEEICQVSESCKRNQMFKLSAMAMGVLVVVAFAVVVPLYLLKKK